MLKTCVREIAAICAASVKNIQSERKSQNHYS